MSVIETRLPAKIEAGFRGGPSRLTQIRTLRNGSERRNALWSMPRHKYVASLSAFSATDRAQLLNVVHATAGQLYGFRFKDWNDYQVTGGALGTAPSGTTAVQLVKVYTFGSQSYTRTITKPVISTVVVYEDTGSGPVAKAGTVDASTGLFTPTSAWSVGATLTANFEFDVPVRFDSDFVEFLLPHRDVRQVSIELIELLNE